MQLTALLFNILLFINFFNTTFIDEVKQGYGTKTGYYHTTNLHCVVNQVYHRHYTQHGGSCFSHLTEDLQAVQNS